MRYVSELTPTTAHDLAIIDSWLVEKFKIDKSRLREPGEAKEDQLAQLARSVVRRALALYGEILVAANVPVYDDGVILQVQPVPNKSDTFRAFIALPIVDNLPSEAFTAIFEQTLAYLQANLTTPPSSDAVELISSKIHAYIDSIKASMPLWGASRTLYKIAYQMGVPYRHMGSGIMSLGWGANRRVFHKTTTEGDSVPGVLVCGNKWQTARILKDAGFPAVENEPVYSHERAIEVAAAFGWPVVVKPADRQQSKGVSLNVHDEAALIGAFDEAKKYSKSVLVERQVQGSCHRILVAAGQIIYVMNRVPKSVIGNGRDTITDLIAEANRKRMEEPPWKRAKQWPTDPETDRLLATQGFQLHSKPDEGQRVFLRDFTSGEHGGNVENLTSQIHPENERLAREVANVLGMTIAGIDFITPDVTKPWYENGGVINEVNYNPEIADKDREKEIPRLISALISDGGRIPVYLITGQGNLFSHAKKLKARLSNEGKQCHLTTPDHSEDSQGQILNMAVDGLFERTLALTLRRDVHAIIMAGQLDEILRDGLAVDRLERVYVVDDDRQRGRRIKRTVLAALPAQSCQLVEA